MGIFKAIAHVALDVSDVERALDFYVRKLGFKEMFRTDFNGLFDIINLRVNDSQYVELFPAVDPLPRGETDSFALEGKALEQAILKAPKQHFSLLVEDLDHTVEVLVARGVPLIRDKEVAIDNNYVAWIADPDGNRIELIEMRPNSFHAQAIARLARAN